MHMFDFNYFDQKARDMSDPDVMSLTRRNLYTLSKALNIPTHEFKKPTPTCLRRYLVDHIQHLWVFHGVESSDNFERIFLWYIFGDAKITDRLQRISDVCYYVACNEVSIQCVVPPSKELLEEFASNCKREGGINDESVRYFMEFGDRLGITFQFVNPQESTAPSMQISDDADIPIKLQQHLQQYGNMADVIKEVCRIQMLGPKYRRADDALGSLLNAWEVMNKE